MLVVGSTIAMNVSYHRYMLLLFLCFPLTAIAISNSGVCFEEVVALRIQIDNASSG